MTKVCPKCGQKFDDTKEFCTTDGEKLVALPAAAAPAAHYVPPVQPQAAAPQVRSSVPGQVTRRYPMLHGFANFLKGFAIFWLVLGGIGVLIGIITMFRRYMFGAGLGIVLGSALYALMMYFLFKVASEQIHCVVDTEENTRQTATYSKSMVDLLNRLLNK